MFIGRVGLVAAVGLAHAAQASTFEDRITVVTDLTAIAMISAGETFFEQDGAKPADPAAPAVAPAKADISFWNGWKRNIDFGINGASGNSENVSVRGLFGTERKTDTLETKASISYVFANSEGEKSKSRGEANIFNNWFFGADSKWGVFAQGKIEYDEFQTWMWRFSGAVGPSYTFIKDEKTTLRGRVGLAAFYETGKAGEEEINPELDIGADWTRQFSDTQKAFATIDYYPSLDEFPAYRITAQAGYEILLSKEDNLSLKLGIQDRYDSTPGLGYKRNDVEYFVTLSFTF